MFFRKLFAESTGYRCPTTIASPNCVLHTASDFEPKAGEVSSRFMTWIHQLFPPVPGKKKYGDVMEGILIKFQWTNPTLSDPKKG